MSNPNWPWPSGPPQSNTSQPPSNNPQAWAAQPPNAQQQQQHPQDANQQHPNGHANQLAPMPSGMQPGQPQMPPILPPPQQMYPPYQQPPHTGYPPQQPAPRQRTAIACRYCRRRKIRCSGFEHSEDGRCTNCQRFSQECVFTPVSAQTQAFVPAHTVWRGQNPPPNAQLYGAYGQPLPQANRDPYQQPPPQQQQHGQYPPPPQGYQQQPVYGQPVPPQDGGRKRANEVPHTPTLPPPNPDAQANGNSERQESARNSMVDKSTQTDPMGSRERVS